MIPEQNTPEWREWRRSKIGASDVAAILGISPWSSPLQLYEEKLGLRSPKDLTAAMARGMDLEEQARIEYERISGELVFPQVVVHPAFDWCIASLDGMSLNKKHIVEIKCPGRSTHELASKGQVPDHYYAQLQHQMFVTGLKTVDYFCFDGEKGFLVVVERDDRFIENMVKEELKFIECLYSQTPPKEIEKDYRDMTKNIDWCSLEYQYVQLCNQLRDMESYKEKLKNDMIALSEGNNAKGSQIKLSKKISKGRIDYDKIEILSQINLDDYRKPNMTSYVITNV